MGLMYYETLLQFYLIAFCPLSKWRPVVTLLKIYSFLSTCVKLGLFENG